MGIYQVTYYDDWMVASKAFYDSSRINIATAFAFALIIMLCATANWIVTLIAFGSLVTTVSTTLALMVFYGWELNVIESIDVVHCRGHGRRLRPAHVPTPTTTRTLPYRRRDEC